MTDTDPLAALQAAKLRLDQLRALLPEREERRDSRLADAHPDPLSEREKRERRERKARGGKNPPVPGWGRRAAIAKLIGHSERNVRNLLDTELARRAARGAPRRLEDPETAFGLLAEAQREVDEAADARKTYYEAIAAALPPATESRRPSGPDAERFTEVRRITGLDASHLRRIQQAVREKSPD